MTSPPEGELRPLPEPSGVVPDEPLFPPPQSEPTNFMNRPASLANDVSEAEHPQSAFFSSGPAPHSAESPNAIQTVSYDDDPIATERSPARSRRSAVERENIPEAKQSPSPLTYLGLALGLGAAAYAATWLFRKQVIAPRGGLPDCVLEHLGSRSLGSQTTLHVVRMGTRLLLLGHSPQGLQTLSEIDDPERVQDLMALYESDQVDTRGLFRRSRGAPASSRTASDPGIPGRAGKREPVESARPQL